MRFAPTFALALAGTAAAACTQPVMRKSWTTLSRDEKLAYLDASLCLMKTPFQGLAGSTTVWEAMQAIHVAQIAFIHNNGAFLGWHRYYSAVHERLLRSKCNYKGAIPYWDLQADVAAGPVGLASIWDPVAGFGSNKTDANGCVIDGPFVNLTNSLRHDFTRSAPGCIKRSLSQDYFSYGAQKNVDNCYAKTDYFAFSDCLYFKPHFAGHGSVGGIMGDPSLSPIDTLFFMHHNNIDRLWWGWQKQNPSARLTQVDGRVYAADDTVIINLQPRSLPLAAFEPYNGDPGNVTTLAHVLWMGNLAPNITIADVMDLNGDVVCAEYDSTAGKGRGR